jgi:hypothetical protein
MYLPEHYPDKFIYVFTSVTSVYGPTGSDIICYINFLTINFPCFLLYLFPVLYIMEC